jgi:large subunit ribosomal protein L10
LKLEKKKDIVADIHDRFSRGKIVVLTDYKGLNVAKMNELRRTLRDAGVEFKVTKNTLLYRAAEGTDVEAIRDYFKGPSAIAISYDDPVAPAKALVDFAKANDKLEIKGGVLDGKLLSVDDIKNLSSLPGREQLLSMLLSTFIGVQTKLVRVLNGVPQKFVGTLAALKDKKEDEAA